MREVVMHAAGDVGSRTGPSHRSGNPTDAVLRLSATCICGSDLWPYRGADPIAHPTGNGA